MPSFSSKAVYSLYSLYDTYSTYHLIILEFKKNGSLRYMRTSNTFYFFRYQVMYLQLLSSVFLYYIGKSIGPYILIC